MSTPFEKILVALSQYEPVECSIEMPPGSVVRSAPSALGTFVGRQLAAIADAAEAGAPTAKRRCDECAYRRGTLPNRHLPTVIQVLVCSTKHEPFSCHKAGATPNDELEPDGICAGWAVVAREARR